MPEQKAPDITIDSILKGIGFAPGAPPKAPEPPTTGEKIVFALSYVAEVASWALLLVSFVAVGLTIVGIFGMASMGSLLGLGFINSSLLAIAGGISGGAIMSAAISIRKIAQDARTTPTLKKIMKAAGLA